MSCHVIKADQSINTEKPKRYKYAWLAIGLTSVNSCLFAQMQREINYKMITMPYTF